MNVLLAIFLFVTLTIIAQPESPHGLQNNAELANTTKAELLVGLS